ncbi:hypothetical protein L7F22_017019 [Adiantum nelumboides]|nr:hypothetical protein [Adiantum nelumboides]
MIVILGGKDESLNTIKKEILINSAKYVYEVFFQILNRTFIKIQSLSGYLERAFTDASSTTSSFEALVWILRCLQELAAVSPFVPAPKGEGNIPGHTEKLMFVKLARLLDDVSQKPFLFWRSRGDLVEAVAKLVVLDPTAPDALLDRFLKHLGDVDYRVRCIMAKNAKVLFQAYTGYEGLFKDICSTFEIQMVMATNDKIVSASEVSLTSRDRCMAETAVMTLGEVAACSEKVEVEAVFMICANAAIFPSLRLLSRTILDDLARQLYYPNRWKYISHLLCCIFSFWVKVGLPLPTLVEIRDLLVCSSEPVYFLKYCSSLMLPPLLLYNRDSELTWLAEVLSKPLSTLVKDSSAAIFSSLLPMFCHGSEEDKELARSVLQGKMLAIANLSEDERDILIRKNMISIVNSLLQLCSVADNPHFPSHTKGAIISSLRIVVDGFCGRGKTCPGVQDVLKIFHADRVVMLGALECLIDVIQENVKVPNTCSLQNLRKVFLYTVDHGIHKKRQIQLQSDSHAAFTLLRSVRQCFDCNSDELADFVGDIIATMGIEDPHAVVFSVPGIQKGPEFLSFLIGSYNECPGSQMNSAVSDDVLKAILLELKTYLLDEHALVIELTVQTLKGMLFTEKGCRVLKSMQPKELNYLSVFSRGPNEKTVEDLLNTMKTESMRKSIPLENDVLWDVNGKAYDEWVCLLVYSLTHYCEDTTLRLCQGIVHCKSFLAECLPPHVLRSLAANCGVKSSKAYFHWKEPKYKVNSAFSGCIK